MEAKKTKNLQTQHYKKICNSTKKEVKICNSSTEQGQ
jgi:hypothetical protein